MSAIVTFGRLGKATFRQNLPSTLFTATRLGGDFFAKLALPDWGYKMRDVIGSRRSEGCGVELGCGTGLNFPRLIRQIGAEGRLIRVDLSPEMLACAQEEGRSRRVGQRRAGPVS
ncbi:MAG: class I SAM-dependent methyltransferase [Planctomycetes bacterium]|nr:class I SAM-dependent methyltransferase [Planctomycetota bacterium]